MTLKERKEEIKHQLDTLTESQLLILEQAIITLNRPQTSNIPTAEAEVLNRLEKAYGGEGIPYEEGLTRIKNT